MRTTSVPDARELGLRQLSARSVVLSLLLGAHPPEFPVRVLVRAADTFGISEPTLRVALTRMVAAGDLVRFDATYRLTPRLVERQRRQDEAIHPATRPWHGQWDLAVVTAIGRPAAERADLRARFTRLRLARLREGVWTRPANLRHDWPAALDAVTSRFTGRPEQDPDALVASLWDVEQWANRARHLLAHFGSTAEPAARITAAAAMVHHLLADPVLPKSLLPPDWPAEALRAAYADYQDELIAMI